MNLAENTPQAMLDRLEEIKSLNPDIETLNYILGNEKILEWIHSVGVSTDQKLRSLAPTVPPLNLRSIVAAPTESVFLWSGLKDAEICIEFIARYIQDKVPESIHVFDFGCGCGRTTRFLQMIPELNVCGADVNLSLVKWCQENLEMITTVNNKVVPPLKFIDGKFDFIYSLSIFTHLNESAMVAWLDELARITSDNGIVLLTTHGYTALDIICQSEQHQQMFQMSHKKAEELRSSLKTKQFYNQAYTSEVIEAANAGEDYGNSFIHDSYIKEQWTRGVFDVVEFIPGGLRGWQDITILRRRVR